MPAYLPWSQTFYLCCQDVSAPLSGGLSILAYPDPPLDPDFYTEILRFR